MRAWKKHQERRQKLKIEKSKEVLQCGGHGRSQFWFGSASKKILDTCEFQQGTCFGIVFSKRSKREVVHRPRPDIRPLAASYSLWILYGASRRAHRYKLKLITITFCLAFCDCCSYDADFFFFKVIVVFGLAYMHFD